MFPAPTPNVPSQTKISQQAAAFHQFEFVSLDGLGLKKKTKIYLKQFTMVTAPRDTGQPVGPGSCPHPPVSAADLGTGF